MHDHEMATSPTEFWECRRDITPSTTTADGEGHRVVLLIDITAPAVRAAGERVTDRLDRFACFDAVRPDAFHLTVKLFDVAVGPETTRVEHLPPDARCLDDLIADVASAHDPFTVEATRFNLFPDVVYGEVDADGDLRALNRELCAHPRVSTLDRDGDAFIPHLTLGYFVDDAEYDALVDHLETDRTLRLPPLVVDELALVAYEVGGRPPTYNQLETYDL